MPGILQHQISIAQAACPHLHRRAGLRGNGPSDENMVRNDGSGEAETIVTFITPPGAPIREDAPPPPGCNP